MPSFMPLGEIVLKGNIAPNNQSITLVKGQGQRNRNLTVSAYKRACPMAYKKGIFIFELKCKLVKDKVAVT